MYSSHEDYIISEFKCAGHSYCVHRSSVRQGLGLFAIIHILPTTPSITHWPGQWASSLTLGLYLPSHTSLYVYMNGYSCFLSIVNKYIYIYVRECEYYIWRGKQGLSIWTVFGLFAGQLDELCIGDVATDGRKILFYRLKRYADVFTRFSPSMAEKKINNYDVFIRLTKIIIRSTVELRQKLKSVNGMQTEVSSLIYTIFDPRFTRNFKTIAVFFSNRYCTKWPTVSIERQSIQKL